MTNSTITNNTGFGVLAAGDLTLAYSDARPTEGRPVNIPVPFAG
jgi:hypothetical protein